MRCEERGEEVEEEERGHLDFLKGDVESQPNLKLVGPLQAMGF